MLGLYLGAMVFGGMLIGLSLILGDSDKDLDGAHDFDVDHDLDLDVDHDLDLDVDHDLDLDVDHDLDLDGGVEVDGPGELSTVTHALEEAGAASHDALWLPFLSLRFWTYFALSFGMTGTLLHFALGMPWMVLLVALCSGSTFGTGAAWFFRRLKQETVTADTRLEQYVGIEARVLLPIRPGSVGKIAIDAPAGRIELMARTCDDQPISRGDRVLVAHIEDGIADVTDLRARKAHRPVHNDHKTLEG